MVHNLRSLRFDPAVCDKRVVPFVSQLIDGRRIATELRPPERAVSLEQAYVDACGQISGATSQLACALADAPQFSGFGVTAMLDGRRQVEHGGMLGGWGPLAHLGGLRRMIRFNSLHELLELMRRGKRAEG